MRGRGWGVPPGSLCNLKYTIKVLATLINTATQKMATPTILAGAQVLEISLLENGLDYKADTKRGKLGKKFARFKYNGIAFSVPADNPFVADFIAGNVKSVKIMEGKRDAKIIDADGKETVQSVDDVDFDSYISRAQWNALRQDQVTDAKIDFQINRLKQLETAPVTEDMLAELAEA